MLDLVNTPEDDASEGTFEIKLNGKRRVVGFILAPVLSDEICP